MHFLPLHRLFFREVFQVFLRLLKNQEKEEGENEGSVSEKEDDSKKVKAKTVKVEEIKFGRDLESFDTAADKANSGVALKI